jgi:hypothetical protein
VTVLRRKDRKKANSFIMLTLRSIWLERNARVFDGTMSSARVVLAAIYEDWSLWMREIE